MMYVGFPLSLRNVEDLLFERGIDICHETVRLWRTRFSPPFGSEIRKQRAPRMRGFRQWRWHLDEMCVKIAVKMHYLWWAVDHQGEVLESFATKTRDTAAALRFMKKAMKRYGKPDVIVTEGLRSYGAAITELGTKRSRRSAAAKTTGWKNSRLPDEESWRC
jgi:putative transposase